MTATLRAKVQGGRLVLDEPIDLPDGTEVDLMPVDDGDDLDDEDRRRLHRALARAANEARDGETFSADEVIASLRQAPSR